MKRVLVTGGAGFIGSCFARTLRAERPEAEIVVLDKLTYAGNLENLRLFDGDPRYRFVKGDIADPEAVKDAMAGCDAVLNFAAETHVDRSIAEPDAFLSLIHI